MLTINIYGNDKTQLNKVSCILYILKVLCATFLIVCFVCLKESFFEMKKMFFIFTLETFFVLEIIRFCLFRYSNVMASINA